MIKNNYYIHLHEGRQWLQHDNNGKWWWAVSHVQTSLSATYFITLTHMLHWLSTTSSYNSNVRPQPLIQTWLVLVTSSAAQPLDFHSELTMHCWLQTPAFSYVVLQQDETFLCTLYYTHLIHRYRKQEGKNRNVLLYHIYHTVTQVHWGSSLEWRKYVSEMFLPRHCK